MNTQRNKKQFILPYLRWMNSGEQIIQQTHHTIQCFNINEDLSQSCFLTLRQLCLYTWNQSNKGKNGTSHRCHLPAQISLLEIYRYAQNGQHEDRNKYGCPGIFRHLVNWNFEVRILKIRYFILVFVL